MDNRTAQSILQQEIQRRQAVEYLVQALEIAAQADESVAKAAQENAKILAQREQLTQSMLGVQAAVDKAKEKAESDMRKIDAEYTQQVTEVQKRTDETIKKLQAEQAAAETHYNERIASLSEWEKHEAEVIHENIKALQVKLNMLQDQVNAEEIRLESIRRLREQLQKV